MSSSQPIGLSPEHASDSRRNTMDLSPAGSGRMYIALAVLGLMGILSWQTMEPGKFRSLTWILLAFFAFRVLLGRLRSR